MLPPPPRMLALREGVRWTPRTLNLLDRHIFKSVLVTCIGAVALFSFVVALGNFYRDLLGPMLAGQISPWMLIRLVLLLFPFSVVYSLPAGILTGVLLTLGRLSADSEITAMRAAGLSIPRIARPVFLLGVLGGVAALYSNFESMPWSRVQYQRELAVAIRTNPLSFIVPKTFIRDFKGVVVYVHDRAGDVLHDVWIWKLDNQSRVIWSARAASGKVDFDEARNNIVLVLRQAVVETLDDKNPEEVFQHAPHVETSAELTDFRVPLDRYLGQDIFHVKTEWLRYGTLQRKQAELAAQKPALGQEQKLRLEQLQLAMIVSEKFNLSVAVLAFAFVAVPLGIKVSRRETSANLAVAVGLVLGYYILITMVKSLDHHPEYRPDFLLWLPNVVFFVFGFWLLRRVQRA